MGYEHGDASSEHAGTAVEAKPVEDWVNDWDWLDPSWGTDAIDIWNSVRDQCPMAMTERYGRAFMPVTMDAVSAIANDTVNFSSEWVSVAQPDATRRPAPPITSNPPEHHGHRRLLLPSFSPKRIAQMETELREYSRELIDEIAGADGGTADAAAQYSQHIPVHGIAQMIGVPESDADIFRDWIYRNFQLAPRDTLLVACDALFDNVRYDEICRLLRSGPLREGVDALARRASKRMAGEEPPAHPDDLTILACRLPRAAR